MNMILQYFLESGIALAAFYCFYVFLFKKDSFYRLHRFYFFFACLISAIIPFLRIPAYNSAAEGYHTFLGDIFVSPGTIQNSVDTSLRPENILLIVYLTGVLISFVLFLRILIKISLLIRKSGLENINGRKFVFLDDDDRPFSFLNIIFIDKKSLDVPAIIIHENAHIEQKHFIDILFFELLCIIFWFNPFIYLFRKSAKHIHEFLADQHVVTVTREKADYQQLLFNKSFGAEFFAVTSGLDSNLVRERIIRISKIPTPSWMKLKVLLLIPLLFIMFMIFACDGNRMKEYPSDIDNFTSSESMQADSDTIAGNQLSFTQPEYPGGFDEMSKFIVDNVKYPAEAREKGIMGDVFVTFTVSSKGKVKDVYIKKGVDKSLDDEAVRVIKNMPDWNPGLDEDGYPVDVEMSIPINFRLQ